MSRNVTRISIKVEHGRISKAMNKFKSKVTNEEIIKTVKERRYYQKPSLKKALKRKTLNMCTYETARCFNEDEF